MAGAVAVLNAPIEPSLLGGTLLSNVTLSASHSPYTVISNLTVPGGITLKIEPGVTMRLRKNCGLTVQGRLVADGTANQPITFTRFPGDANWERLLFVQAEDSLLRNCVIEYADCEGDHKDYYATNCVYPLSVGPRQYYQAVVALGCHLDLERCVFTNLFDATGREPEGDAIAIISDDLTHRGPASAHIRGCQFRGIGQGIHTRYAYVLVEDCYFAGKSGDNDDIDLYGESSLFGLPNPVVRNNLFDVPSSDDRINPTRCSAIISENVFLGSTDHAVVLRDTCNPIVINNLFYAPNPSYRFPSGGIAIQNGCDALIVNNTFIGINSAIKLFDHQGRIGLPYCLSSLSGRATVINCVFWNSNRAIDVSGSAGAPFQEFRVNLSHCLLQGGTNSISTGNNTRYQVDWGPGIINLDPLFVNAAGRDYRLRADSPGIDGGTRPGILITTNTLFVGTNRVLYAVTNDLDAVILNDLDQVPRPLDGKGTGAAQFDLGAYERLMPSADSNQDGLPDGWSWRYGFNPSAPGWSAQDPDRDGMNNVQEYLADTDPTNALSRFQIQPAAPANSGTVSFLSSTNRLYTLFLSTNLAAGIWTNLPTQTGLPGRGGKMTLNDTNPAAHRFYRVGAQLP